MTDIQFASFLVAMPCLAICVAFTAFEIYRGVFHD